MEMAGQRAIQLDPKHAEGHTALACIQSMKGKWVEAEDLFNRALKLDPNDPEALHYYSVMLALLGKSSRALALRKRLQTLDPLVPVYDIVTAIVMWTAGQRDDALSIMEAMPPDAFGGFYRNVVLAEAYTTLGRFAEAADKLLLITGNQVSRRSVKDAARLLRSRKAKVPDALPQLEGDLNFVYAYVGATERLMDFPERTRAIGFPGSTANYKLWFPENAPLRKTGPFKAYVRACGMVDYWRARGWPDLCRPVSEDDFVCD